MKVFVNGCFDVLHVGHFNMLSFCKRLAGPNGIVIVAIDSDERVRELKGKGPIFKAFERRHALYKLEYPNFIGIKKGMVDIVDEFKTDDELISLINSVHKPDLMVKGIEWKSKKVIGAGGVADLVFYHETERKDYNKFSSADIINRIRDGLHP